ncbi:hypothetical protein ACHQM5_002081 [Ranunculus cassubicifolius]
MDWLPQFKDLYKFDTKRLILLVGIVFSVFLVLQSESLPYGNLISSILTFKSVNATHSIDSSVVLGVINNTESIDVVKDSNLDSENEDIGSPVEEDHIVDFKPYSKDSVVLDKNREVDNVAIVDRNSSLGKTAESPNEGEVWKSVTEDTGLTLENDSSVESGFVSQPPVSSTITLSDNSTFSGQSDTYSRETKASTKPGVLSNSSSRKHGTAKKEKGMPPPTSISKMASLLRKSRVTSRAMRPRWSSARDQELLSAKSEIERAPVIKSDPELYPPLYRNISMFKRSYELMENTLKVYIYTEGDQPVFHQPLLKGIYSSEGWFMKLMEENKQFVVKDPTQAHMFYLPFSAYQLRLALYNPKKHRSLAAYMKDYVDLIAKKYRFWNRTGGADHFLVACHDWAPQETIRFMGTCIRALCNSNVARSFQIGKDVSLPVTMVRFPDEPLRSLGGKPPLKRPFLAFFAGNMHGYLRPVLLEHWQNDADMRIFGPLPRDSKPNYLQYMKSSKFCICARGYEVHTPRVIEAIFHDCVPVIISDNYVPPFFEILNWQAFSVFVMEKDVPDLKNILLGIPKKKYLEMQMRVRKVQKHFLWHKSPVKYDIFHMTLHSIWYNRVFQIKPR